MRNPVLIFPIGIVFVVLLAAVSVKFGVMTTSELLRALKTLSVILIPMTLIGGAFAYTYFKDGKRE